MRLASTLFSLVVMVAGCATMPPPDVPLRPAPEAWRLIGRLALSNGSDGGSGRLSWDHHLSAAGRDDLRFHGALGRGSWRLTATPHQAVLVTADGESATAADVGVLIAANVGWQIPFESLAHWVTGRPEPGVRFSGSPASKRLETFRQHRWLVRVEGYHQVGEQWLPRKIVASRGEDEVRLVVKSWQLGQPGAEGG